MTEKKATALEESLKNYQNEYNNLCANIGHLIVQNVYNDQEREKLMTEILSVIRKVNTLKTNQPKPVAEEQGDTTNGTSHHVEETNNQIAV